MISPAQCAQKAEDCEAEAAACDDPAFAQEWRELAAEWRRLAADEDSQTTTARLMSGEPDPASEVQVLAAPTSRR